MYLSRKKAWVRALKSGKYLQASGTLCRLESAELDEDGTRKPGRTPKGFCCLGVLCDLATKDGVEMKVSDGPTERNYDGNTGHLPEAVRIWAGLKDINPFIIPRVVESNGPKCDLCGTYHDGENVIEEGLTATAANDERNLTFPEIADLISKNL